MELPTLVRISASNLSNMYIFLSVYFKAVKRRSTKLILKSCGDYNYDIRLKGKCGAMLV